MAARSRKRSNWIAGAVKRKGAFRAKARRAGKSVAEFAREKRNAPGRLGREARLAATLRKFNRGHSRTSRKARR